MTSPHRYGPHQPELAPNAVTVLTGGRSQGAPIRTEVRPLPLELVRQRETINQLAHFGALLRTVPEPCPHTTRRATGECNSCGARRG